MPCFRNYAVTPEVPGYDEMISRLFLGVIEAIWRLKSNCVLSSNPIRPRLLHRR